MKVCVKCKQPKSISDFYDQTGRNTKMAWCKKCVNLCTCERQLRNKAKAVLLAGGKCIRCGYSKCIAALEFHHVNPENKEQTSSDLRSRSWKRYLEEIKKCILLCANCHREEEENLRAHSTRDNAVLS